MKTRIYKNHRENQRARILDAAQELFNRDGYDNVSISDIATAARLSRVTLYEYFANKQEIGWAIFFKVSKDLNSLAINKPESHLNGFEQLSGWLMHAVDLLENYPHHFRFIVEFNTLYAREGNPGRIVEIVEQTWDGGDTRFDQAVRIGIIDGSIRPDLDPDLLSASIMNLVNALNGRFALLGSLIEEEFKQPVRAMYREICLAFLRGIQNNQINQEKPV